MKPRGLIEPNHRILVVDDNRAIHDDLRKILASDGSHDLDLQTDESILFDAQPVPVTNFEIDSAYQGEEGLEKLREAVSAGRPYALAFVDVRMPPGWDGVETITQFRKVDPDLQTVICTAYSDYSWNDIQRRLGHADSLLILKKPFDNIEVIQLAHALSRKWLLSRQAEARMVDLDLMVAKRTAELQAANELIQKKLQEKAEAEEAFRVVFQASPIGITLMDMNGRYLDVNRAFEAQYQVTRCEIVGSDVVESGFLDQVTLDALRNEITEFGAISGKEVKYSPRSGGTRTGLLWARTVAIGHVPHLLGFLLDISERKQMEEELQRAREAAEAAAKAKSVFLANMSHEIRTPLSGVLGLSSLLDSQDIPQNVHSMVRLIRQSGEMLGRVIDDVLDFSKIDSGRLELEWAPFSLEECLEWSIGLYQKIALEKNIRMQFDYDRRIPKLLLGDSTRMKQVVANLISNAVKFTPSGSIRVKAELAGGGAEPGGACRIRVAVTDTGIGIPPDRLDRLFHSFTQVDPSTNRRYGGTGLGLAISKRLVEMMGGDIRVESAPGVATTFEFTVLLSVAESLAPARAAGLPTAAGMRILVAEDNKVNQVVALHMLKNMGHQADLVDDGEAAIQQVQSHQYDLVLMDVQMPGIDGLEATQRIRTLPHPCSAIPIVALTASATTEDRETCLGTGMNDYISKPLRPDALGELLNRWNPHKPHAVKTPQGASDGQQGAKPDAAAHAGVGCLILDSDSHPPIQPVA
ncbi:MAG TPA: response regulator [Bryobacteraceae bacterium]|nr:response regulator [Bryobacteraceae bacterium]